MLNGFSVLFIKEGFYLLTSLKVTLFKEECFSYLSFIDIIPALLFVCKGDLGYKYILWGSVWYIWQLTPISAHTTLNKNSSLLASKSDHLMLANK